MAEKIDPKQYKADELREMAREKNLNFSEENTKAELAEMLNMIAEADEKTATEKDKVATIEAEADMEAAAATEEVAEIDSELEGLKAKRHDKALKAYEQSGKLLYVEWTAKQAAPDFYFNADPARNRSDSAIHATVVELEDRKFHSFYRLLDCPAARDIWVGNPNTKILAPEEITEDLRISLRMADLEERKREANNRKRMASLPSNAK